MDYFSNYSYIISHLFLMAFLYLFITHRYSKTVTRCICIVSFLLLTATDCLKLNLYPNSDLCYVCVTIFQIILTQSTGILISKKRNTKVLFMDLSASNYVIIGSILACVLYIYTGHQLLALAGSFTIHSAFLYILYISIHDIWIRQYEREYTKGWWQLCLIPVFFYCSFSFITAYPITLYEYPQNIPGILFLIITMVVSYIVVLHYAESETAQKNIYLKSRV